MADGAGLQVSPRRWTSRTSTLCVSGELVYSGGKASSVRERSSLKRRRRLYSSSVKGSLKSSGIHLCPTGAVGAMVGMEGNEGSEAKEGMGANDLLEGRTSE